MVRDTLIFLIMQEIGVVKMAQRNYMNTNDVYPILDMINRKVNQGKGVSHQSVSPIFNDDPVFDTSQWQVESFEVIRDTTNAIDPEVIKQVIIVYRNGAIDTITLTRGLVPNVPSTVKDYEYINNLMIVELEIETVFGDRVQIVNGKIFKENGYGNFQKVELTYNDTHWHEEEEDSPDEDMEYENPNDFYDGGGSDSGYDTDVDTAEDYADTPYAPSDEVEMPESGWADGYNPSSPVDVDIDVPTEVI